MNTYDDTSKLASDLRRYEANQLFHEAYEAQQANDYERAIELYKRSIETYPTAEAHTFLGWVYSFQDRYDEAIAECLEAIRVDETLGNPYNDIGSYLLAKGDSYGSVRWFKRALLAPRYESYAFPHFNLGRVYENRKKFLDARSITAWRSSKNRASERRLSDSGACSRDSINDHGLLVFDQCFLTLLINSNVDHFRFRHAHSFAFSQPLNLNDHTHGYRRGPDADGLSVEAHQVSDVNRFVKDDFLHRHGDEPLHVRVTMRFDRPGSIDVTKNDAAKDRPLRVGVAWQ
jgi:tetratricopeptide (TPR) repeat protein